MSLKEDLQEILVTVINSGLGLGINKKGEFDSENSYIKKYNYTIEEAKQAIFTSIIKHLPDIEKHVCRFNDGEQTCDCFKECLDEVNKLLTTNKKGKV